MRTARFFLENMIAAINDIQSFTRGVSSERFMSDKMIQNAVIRSLEIIGESAKHVPPVTRKKHQDIEWKSISGMRDILIHEYFGVDHEKVWNVIVLKLPKLKEQIVKIRGLLSSKG